jgi:hypothetical protein
MELDADTATTPTATRCPSTVQEDEAETLKDAVLITLAATATVEDAATVNAPKA